jgi:hypothetical protein
VTRCCRLLCERAGELRVYPAGRRYSDLCSDLRGRRVTVTVAGGTVTVAGRRDSDLCSDLSR